MCKHALASDTAVKFLKTHIISTLIISFALHSRVTITSAASPFCCALTRTQRYLIDPFLIAGHKHDLRLYVLVTQFRPTLEAFLYTEGFARFSTVRCAIRKREILLF
jgi:hypothetical protein